MSKTTDAMALIPTGYAYGDAVPLSAPLSKDGKRAIRAIADTTRALHLFSVCAQCDDSRSWYARECRNVTVFSESDDDILGQSNRDAFRERYGDAIGVTMHGFAYGFAFCVDPDRIDAETLESILDDMASYADYPVFDESDYSERENNAWNESLAEEMVSAYVPEESRDALATWVSENYYGYSDPGYVSRDWIAEGMAALGIVAAE